MVRNKERHCIMIKRTIQQEDKTLVNVYAPNIGAPKSVKQLMMCVKGEMDRNTDTVEDLTPHCLQ